MSEAPTGIVTLVFTDIQGSTALWEHLNRDFKPLLDQHNTLFRAAIDEFGGYEVKTEGDAFMVAFWDAQAAVAMCLAMQERLQEAEWSDALNHKPLAEFAGSTEDGCFRGLRVRMGVHTGSPEGHSDPVTGRMDYFGRMVNRAGRVGSVGHGGQVVVSEATWLELDEDGLPEGTVTKDLGKHALKGLERREHLRQLLPSSLAERTFPRLKTANLKRTNLPPRLDSFFGRGPEIAELKQRMADGQRLITVLGAGGTGKTRLSQRFGGTQLMNFPGGVWVCDLTEARTKVGVLSAMGVALEVPLTSGDPEAQLAKIILSRGRVLVILDNFEQVVNHAADTLGRWLQHAPEAVFVVTSRSLLHIGGEEVLYLDPLPIPEAVNLFCDRARAVRPDFERTDENEPVVTEIIERLDCMSLAVELAAARVRILSPEKILERLSQRFKLLRGQRRDQSARQATLRGAIDWSWELLQPYEQAALAQFSVFRGGSTLEAAEAVVDLDAFDEDLWTMDVIEALIGQSVLRRVEPRPGHVRYRMLESIREYAAEKLAEETAATRLRHAQYFAQFGTDTRLESLDIRGGVERRRALGLEGKNLLAGTDAGLAADEPEVAAGCALAAGEVFQRHGPFSDGIALLQQVLGQPVGRETQGRLFYKAGWLLYLAGRLAEAVECYRQALEIAREVGDRRGEGHALGGLAVLHREQGRIQEALEHFHQALEIAREVGNRLSEGHTLGGLAFLHCEQGRIQEALEHHHQSLAIIREVGDRRQEGLALGNLGDLLFLRGDLQSAETRLLQAIPICDETWSVAAGVFRGSLALLRAQQGAFDEARALLDKGEPQVRGVYKLELGKLLCKKARVEQLAGDLGAATAALAEAEAIDVELGSDPDAELSKLLAETRAALDS